MATLVVTVCNFFFIVYNYFYFVSGSDWLKPIIKLIHRKLLKRSNYCFTCCWSRVITCGITIALWL